MKFYCGLHIPSQAYHFERAMISFNRLVKRKGMFKVTEWIMDSGAFSELSRYGEYLTSVEDYAQEINRWADCGILASAVTQDYMCEPLILEKTKLSISDHQRLTIERFDSLRPLVNKTYVMSVLQGYSAEDYISHGHQYGDRISENDWVGIGSICKRNSNPKEIEHILRSIKKEFPNFRFHGFGLKITSLANGTIWKMLFSADSMAWSYAARREGRNPNSWLEARNFVSKIENMPIQWPLWG